MASTWTPSRTNDSLSPNSKTWSPISLLGEEWIGNAKKGLPQGSSLSPILTILVLDEFVNQCEDSVFYADDGLFMSNKPFKIKDDPASGILLSQEKSKWIKWDAKWLSPLVFLGLQWWNKLTGHTRKGSRLDISLNNKEIFKWLKKLNPEYGTWSGLLNKTNLGGTMIQRLYNGKWDESFYAWKVTLTGVKNSWLGLQKDNFTTHSSEACAFLGGILRGEKRTLWAKRPEAKTKCPTLIPRGTPKFVWWNLNKKRGSPRGSK